MVLSNSGHDHLRNFCVFLQKKSHSPYAVAPTASAIHVLLAPEGCISGGLRGVLPMENPLRLGMSQQRWERDRGYRKVEQDGIRLRSGCAWTSQHKLHDSHVSLILPFEEPTTSA